MKAYKRELQDYNEYREKQFAPQPDFSDQPSGVACPKCKEELRVNNTITLTSSPPQRHSWCNFCKWRGYL